MKNLIITVALATLFAMLISFPWELNSRSWQRLSKESMNSESESGKILLTRCL